MAFQIIYTSTDLTIEREDTPTSGSGTDEDPFVYAERRTWHKLLVDDPNRTDLFDEPAAQRIVDKIADFEALIALIESSPDVTSGNVVGQFQALKDELPDIVKALIFLGKQLLYKP